MRRRDMWRPSYVVRAEVGAHPIWTLEGDNVDPDSLPLSHRVLVALEDWRAFYDDVGGAMSDEDVLDEFVGQGFKVAHAIRRQLKGSTVYFDHPVTGDRYEIMLRRLR